MTRNNDEGKPHVTDPVVITGAGIITALGDTVSDIWSALHRGISGINSFEHAGQPPCTAAVVQDFDPAGLGIHPRDARIMGKHTHMLIKASRDAHHFARMQNASLSPEDIGFYAGMGMVDYEIEDLLPAVLKSIGEDGSIDYDRFYASAYQEIHPLWPLFMLNNISFCQAAIGLEIRGENTVFSPHADSGALAVVEGMRTLLDHKARIVIAGGVSETVSPLSLARGTFFDILAPETDSIALCSPFGNNRQGTVLGEGCGMISMELRSHADERGAAYSTMISGYGISCSKDAEVNCPSIYGIKTAMQQALEAAEVRPRDIDVIIAHGDGTQQGDRNEAEAINEVFLESPVQPVVYASKAALGHLLAGAAPVDIILGSRMIEQKSIPPVAGSYFPDSTLRVNLIKDLPLFAKTRRVMINAFSYEGQCSSLIIEAVRV